MTKTGNQLQRLPYPEAPAKLELYSLKEQFEQNGFVILKEYGIAQSDELQAAAIHELEQQQTPFELEADVQYPGAPVDTAADGGLTPRRLLHAYQRNELFSKWASNQKLAHIYRYLLGSKQLMLNPNHHNCLMTKLPDFSSDTLWHRDTRYWAFDTPNLLNSWLALGNEQSDNGGMKVIPRSHTLELTPDQVDQKQFLKPNHPKNRLLFAQAKTMELKRGDVLVFSAHLIHTASRNFTDKPKLSLVFTYHGEDTKPLPGSRSDSLPEIVIS